MNIDEGLLLKIIIWFIGINFVLALFGSGLIMMRRALKNLKKSVTEQKKQKDDSEKNDDDETKKLY